MEICVGSNYKIVTTNTTTPVTPTPPSHPAPPPITPEPVPALLEYRNFKTATRVWTIFHEFRMIFA